MFLLGVTLPTGLLLSLPLAGFLVAKLGSRIIVAGAAILYALTLPMIGVMNQPYHLVMVLFVFGMAGNMLNISMNTQGVGVELGYGRSIMASFHGIWSLAGFTGASIGTFMISSQVIPPYHFLAISATALVILATGAPAHAALNMSVIVISCATCIPPQLCPCMPIFFASTHLCFAKSLTALTI